ncbi:MAG: tetraether lipid synthase Tes [Candidatus Sigynarchaeota archaeon]
MFHVRGTEFEKKKYYRKTRSICPECLQPIDAVVFEEDGPVCEKNKVKIKKDCPTHGHFEDIISTNALYYKWTHFQEDGIFSFDKDGEANPPDNKQYDPRGCPYNCGLCPEHKSTCSLALIDVTNRCNLRCAFCYANVEKSGILIEPSLDEIRKIMRHFRSKPIPAVAIMFTGGEPTVRKDFVDIVRMAKEEGFKEVLVATNGYGFQRKDGVGEKFARDCWEAGLDTLYFQFDGIHDETYEKTRGQKNFFSYKLRALENCRKAGLDSIVLVPTIAKGVTDIEIGNILQFAMNNLDIIRGVTFQPVSLCGRVSFEELRELRFTNADTIREIEKQTNGVIAMETSWYPLTTIVEFGRIIAWLADIEPIEFTCHPDCGFATFLVLNPSTGKMESILDYFDAVELVRYSNMFWRKLKDRKKPEFFSKALDSMGEAGKNIGQLLDRGLDWLDKNQLKARFVAGILPAIKKPGKLMEIFSKMLVNGKWEAVSAFVYGSLFIGSMHFQDAYNFDLDRSKRCIVHFGVWDPHEKRVIESPFCVMNSVIRGEIEKKIARPWKKSVEEWHTPEEAKQIIAENQAAGISTKTPVAQNGGEEARKE